MGKNKKTKVIKFEKQTENTEGYVLKYKTRANSDYLGKSKVYFSAHPKDFKKYFESISDEILALENCAVWYDDGRGVLDKEYLTENIKQMQLFVFPVTKRFLESECRALTFDFKIATENHIPILPIMEEPGLERIFNKVCGEIQFLDKYSDDDTKISYEKQLEKFITSVLINDETTEEVRAEFDARAFLSYRKIDRKHALELIKNIHKNESLMGLAIWYDEYLVPGEDFNDNIKNALVKSDAFLMAVTPNMVSDENYIITTEYPMAKAENKPIVPFEMIETERKILEEKYEDIPNCIKGNSDKDIESALIKTVKERSLEKEKKAGEHEFLIGLAYLSGIDVEVDVDRGLKLLEEAAEKGSCRAMKKLSDMYENGIGVSISYEKASCWKEKEIEALLELYAETEDYEKFLDVYFEINQCGEINEVYVRDFEKAYSFYKKALEYTFEYIARTKSRDKRLLGFAAESYQAMGDAKLREKDYAEASVCFEEAGKVFSKRLKEEISAEAYYNLSNSILSLIEVRVKEGNLAVCKEQEENQIESIEAAVSLMPIKSIRINLGHTYEAFSKVNFKLGNNERALELAEKTVNVFKCIKDEFCEYTDKRNYLIILDFAAEMYKDTGFIDKQLSTLLEAYRIACELVAEKNADDIKIEMSAICRRIADIYMRKDNEKKFTQYIEKGLEAIKGVSEMCEEENIQKVNLLSLMSSECRRKGKISEAKKHLEELIKHEELFMGGDYFYLDKEETARHFISFGVHYDLLGELYEGEEYHAKALSLYESALEKFAKAREFWDVDEITEDYIICLRKLTTACIKVGTSYFIKGYNYMKECEKLCEERYERVKNGKYAWELCLCYAELSTFHKDKIEGLENPELSEYYEKKGFELAKEMKETGLMDEALSDAHDKINRLPYKVMD